MNALMLRTSVRSSVNMEDNLTACNQRFNQKLLEWMVDLDYLFVEFDLCGTPKTGCSHEGACHVKGGTTMEVGSVATR